MSEGETVVPSAGDSGGDASASSQAAGSLTGSGAAGATGGTGSLASGEGGSAPAPAADAAGGVGAPAQAAVPAALPGFMFAGRKWDSQKQAEEAWKANLGRNWQGKLTEAQQQLAQKDAELQALREALTGRGGNGQGAAQASQAPAGPQGFAEKLVKSGELDFLTGLLSDPDPQMGVQKFTLALADRMDREMNERLEQVRSEEIQPILRQRAFDQHMGTAMGAAKALGTEFPELDANNQSPEAVEHQQAFIENLKQFPPDFVTANPQFAMLATALVTRYQQGVPVFAQTPGTSGSPSARAALASEQAYGAAAGTPIDGTGTPRPRPNGAGETPLDRIRRENAGAPANFRSPTGRDLGFGPA